MESRIIGNLLDHLDALKAENAKLRQQQEATTPTAYRIGTENCSWGDAEREQWFTSIVDESSGGGKKRSYFTDVVDQLEPLKEHFNVEQYATIEYETTHGPYKYPVFAVKSRDWQADKPTCLVTGGVHGYETSGIMGALLFLQSGTSKDLSRDFNLIVVPCVSPWGYEHIQRWNPNAVDPNRCFQPDQVAAREAAAGPLWQSIPIAQEAAAVSKLVEALKLKGIKCHVDLHETTDTDESEFCPAKAARDGKVFEPDTVPDGFYLVGDTERPQEAWQKAIIEEVKKVTHIAPADANGCIIGEKIEQNGVINYPFVQLGLCAGVANAEYATTTEVYPDSPSANDDQCNKAQVAAIVGALKYILKQEADG